MTDQKNCPERKRNPLGAMGHWLGAHAFGVIMTLLVFLALPFLQIVANFGKKDLEIREVAVVKPPPPPPMTEELPPEEPPEPEDKPDLVDDLNTSLSDLSLDLAGGIEGNGARILKNALSSAMQRADSAFSMSDLDQKPRPLQQVPPQYPPTLLRQKVEGVVKIDCVIDPRGRVVNPRIVSSPHPLFNDAAMDAVKQWRFEPGVRDGEKVPFKIRIPIRFGSAAVASL